jgi:hypothetical protein
MFNHELMLSQCCHAERSEATARIGYQLRPAVPSFVGMTTTFNKCSIMNFLALLHQDKRILKKK